MLSLSTLRSQSHTPHLPVRLRKRKQISRLKEEIKFLYKKKGKLNESVYGTRLQVAREWGKTWDRF